MAKSIKPPVYRVRYDLRKVKVEIVADKERASDEYSKIPQLKRAGVPVYLYSGHNKMEPFDKTRWQSIMHNKFMIFDKGLNKRPLLWTGSFNFTHSAAHSNQENVLVLEDNSLIGQYVKQFEVVKKRCEPARAVGESELLCLGREMAEMCENLVLGPMI